MDIFHKSPLFKADHLLLQMALLSLHTVALFALRLCREVPFSSYMHLAQLIFWHFPCPFCAESSELMLDVPLGAAFSTLATDTTRPLLLPLAAAADDDAGDDAG